MRPGCAGLAFGGSGGGALGGGSPGVGVLSRLGRVAARHDLDLAELVALSVRARRGLPQPAQQQVHSLGEAVLVRVEAAAEDFEIDPRPAPADAEHETAARRQMQQRGLLAERDGMGVGQHR